MKRAIAIILTLALILSVTTSFADMTKEEYAAAKTVDRSKLVRYLITTDLEVDDYNGVIMTLLYNNEYDLAGIVWSAGMFHFSGDGEHTLGEITPNNACPRLESDTFTEYRPVDPDWVPSLIREAYAADYEYLIQNDPNYLTPDELMGLFKVGNIAFEGDVREDTEGSDWIKACMLDDDPRPLFITAWGGINTTVRALLSIYEEYGQTEQWDEIRQKITDKCYFSGKGEDNCWADQKIDEIYPGLHFYSCSGAGGYSSWLAAAPTSIMPASADVIDYLQAEWTTENFKFNHGEMMNRFFLMGDGQVIKGEADFAQFGLQTYVDWAGSPENNEKRDLSMVPRVDFDQYDWMCCQWGGHIFINFGLRGSLENPNYGNIGGRYSIDGVAQNRAANYRNEYNPVTGTYGTYSSRFSGILYEELAARADWTCKDYGDCNHPVILTAENLDLTAAAGEKVQLAVTVNDPDGDSYTTDWWVWNANCEYDGACAGMLDTWGEDGASAMFTVPTDAQPGDYFNVILQVRDNADTPMTRFAQFIITVPATAAE